MRTYSTDELLALDKEALWALPEGRHRVSFYDGVIETHTRATILSVYYWFAVREYPETPISKEWHVESVGFDSGKMIDAYSKIIWGIYDHYASLGKPVDRDHLAYLTMDTQMNIYNDFTTRLSAYVTTFSMFDLLEIMDHPEVKKANDNVKPSQYSIESETYPAIGKVLKSKKEFPNNHIALGVRLGTTSLGQVLQCVSVRGYTTDIDSSIFQYPIMGSYVGGITNLYESMTESRSGAKAQGYNKELISDTETFNREMQLMTQTVKNLHRGDCGTQVFLEVPVLKELLPTMAGKYYLREDGVLDVLKGNETHLLDKRIRIRSVLGCMHEDPNGICSVCYGKIADAIPDGTNLGHVSATTIGDKITSAVLSTKHLDSTSHVDPFRLGRLEAKYLRADREEDTIYFKDEMKHDRYYITLLHSEAAAIADLLIVDDPEILVNERLSSLTHVLLETPHPDDPDTLVPNELCVSQYNRKSSLTMEALLFIRDRGWEYLENNGRNIRIDMTGWDTSQPFLGLPFTHVNMVEYKNEFERFYTSGSGGRQRAFKRKGRGMVAEVTKAPRVLKDYENVRDALIAFALKSNDKISSNIVHREILLYAMMAQDPDNDNYHLPKPGISGKFINRTQVFRRRSLAPLMAYKHQADGIFDISSYMVKKRPDSPFDNILTGGTQFNR